MKRTGTLRRKAYLKSTTPLPRWTKLKPVNRESTAKRKARYTAYMSSPAWREKRAGALERAGYRCELVVRGLRCPATKHLHVHHLTYARFRREMPSDLQVLCRSHHEAHHADQAVRPRGVR